MWHEEIVQLSSGEELATGRHAQDLVVGSGEFGHSYAFYDGDFLVQSPLTWYAPRAEWGMSPGFDDPHHLSFRRTISTGCLFCHAGIVREKQENPYHPEIVEHAIGCERCHGPGSLHADRHSSGSVSDDMQRSDEDRTIVNPAKLSRDLAEDVCQQCHLQSDAHIDVRGRDQFDYRPGLPLSHFRLELRDRQKSEMTIVGHAEQLHLSRCFQESGELRCTSCHDPHRPLGATEKVAYYRQACLKCHAVEHCPEAMSDPALRGDDLDCTVCHMPKSATEIPHVAFTHHRIGKHRDDSAGETLHETTERGVELVAVQDVSGLPSEEVDRCRGLGAWDLYQLRPESPQRMEYGRQAEELLVAAWESGIRDPQVAAALAGIAEEFGDHTQAETFAQWVLQQELKPIDARVAALEIGAQQNFRRNNFSAALHDYHQLTQLRREARSWFFLGLCAQNLDDSEAAIAALERSLQINPAQAGAHQALAAIHHARGALEESAKHQALAAALAGLP